MSQRLTNFFRIIPVLIAVYLCCYFDRTNVGNAKILGIENDLGLDAHKYGTALAVFYVFYILAEIPSALLLKKITPKVWLAGLGFACGIIGMCLAFVRNYAGFLVVRILLGLFEGG
jgi:sugar phosphate permease